MSPLSFGLGSSRAFGIASSIPAGPWSVIYDFSDSACYSGSGNTITDLEGNVDATVVGATYNSAGGYFNLSSASQGDGYIAMNSTTPEISPTYTIDVWFKFNAVSSGLIIFDGSTMGGFGFPYGFNVRTESTNGNIGLVWNVSNSGANFPNTVSALATNTFYHIVVTQDSTDKRVYTNNVNTVTGSSPTTFSAQIDTPIHFGIQSYDTATATSSNIDLYEFRMYNRGFTVAEVDARFQASRTKYGI